MVSILKITTQLIHKCTQAVNQLSVSYALATAHLRGLNRVPISRRCRPDLDAQRLFRCVLSYLMRARD
jgi:hypothetical protein